MMRIPVQARHEQTVVVPELISSLSLSGPRRRKTHQPASLTSATKPTRRFIPPRGPKHWSKAWIAM